MTLLIPEAIGGRQRLKIIFGLEEEENNVLFILNVLNIV